WPRCSSGLLVGVRTRVRGGVDRFITTEVRSLDKRGTERPSTPGRQPLASFVYSKKNALAGDFEGPTRVKHSLQTGATSCRALPVGLSIRREAQNAQALQQGGTSEHRSEEHTSELQSR